MVVLRLVFVVRSFNVTINVFVNDDLILSRNASL